LLALLPLLAAGHPFTMHQGTLSVDNTTGAQPGGAFGAFASPPEIFKTLHSNSDICRNFKIIKLQFCIQLIFKISFT